MNYLAEIKSFQEFAQDKALSSGQIALWYALMYINNRTGWSEWFTVANSSLQNNSGLSRGGINKCRNSLKQFGLIDFKANGTKASFYKMTSFSDTTAKSVQNGNDLETVKEQFSVQNGNDLETVKEQFSVQNSGTLNKLNETKLNETKNKEINLFTKKIEDYTENESLRKELKAFISHRKQIKKPLSEHSFDLLLKSLDTLSAEYRAKDRYKVECLQASMLNSWQGVFALKDFADDREELTPLPDNGPRIFSEDDNIEDFL